MKHERHIISATCAVAQDVLIVAGAGWDSLGLGPKFSGKRVPLVHGVASIPSTALLNIDRVVEPSRDLVDPFLEDQTIFSTWCDNAPAQPRRAKSPNTRALHSEEREALPAAGAQQEGHSDGADGRGRNHRWMWLSGLAAPLPGRCLTC